MEEAVVQVEMLLLNEMAAAAVVVEMQLTIVAAVGEVEEVQLMAVAVEV